MRNLFLFTVVLFSSMSFGWGDLGHGIVGEIAERELQKDPKAMAWVHSILGAEPVAVAAIWPDKVRPSPLFDKPFEKYHYLEVAYSDSIRNETEEDFSKRFSNRVSKEKDAETFLEQAYQNLKSGKLDILGKQVLLRYVIHIIGDVHMPFHVGNGRDHGANQCRVNWVSPHGEKRIENLHWVIDSVIFEYLEEAYWKQKGKPGGAYFTYQNGTDYVLSQIEKTPTKLTGRIKDLNRIHWYQESQRLHEIVYPDFLLYQEGNTSFNSETKMYKKAEDRPFCNPEKGKSVLPTLDNSYVDKTLPILIEQVYVAGKRLAGVISYLAKDYKGKGPDIEKTLDLIQTHK